MNNFNKIFLLFVFAITNIYSQVAQKGTLIAIMKTKDTIFVAGDSKISRVKNSLDIFHRNTLEDYLGRIYNKIGYRNNIGFAVAGILKGEAFDLSTLCDSVCNMSGTIFEITKKFQEIISAPIKKVFENTNASDPNELESQVAFYGFYDDKPIVILQKFKYIDYSLKITTRPTIASRVDSSEIYLLGIGKYFLDVIQTRTINFNSSSRIGIVKSFVETAINLFPQICGGPIDILIVTKKGHKWIQ